MGMHSMPSLSNFLFLLIIINAYISNNFVCNKVSEVEIGRFVETRKCKTAEECGGRACYNGLCTGFSGNDYISYICYLGRDCVIDSVPGNFDQAVQKRYKIKILPYESECDGITMSGVNKKIHHSTRGYSGKRIDCLVNSNKGCTFTIQKESLRVGRYRLCGSPFSQEEEDFENAAVPIGSLYIFGLKAMVDNDDPEKEIEYNNSYINRDIVVRNKSIKLCTANVPCSVSGISGFGMSDNVRIMEIYSPGFDSGADLSESKYNSDSEETRKGSACGEGLREGERVYVHKCRAYNGGTECFFSSVSAEPQITLLCGCMIGGGKKCTSPLEFDTYLSKVVYHRGILPTEFEMRGKEEDAQQTNSTNNTEITNVTNASSFLAVVNEAGGVASEDGKINQKTNGRRLQMDPCATCVNGYGLCYGTPKTCYGGFGNNPYEPPLILCVDGYDCRVKGKVIGEQITSRYKVAASPVIGCGVRILGNEESMFHSRNQWNCEGGNPFDCELHFGVGRRYNRSESNSNTMLLCGCPDFASSGMPCDEPAEFYFPVAQIRVVECTDNTHCMHNALASCNSETNQCQGVLPSVAQIGLGTMRCLSRQSCTIANIGQFIGGEMYRVIQTAPYVKCGANVALDPEYYQKVQAQMESTGPGGMGLPCIVQGGDNSGGEGGTGSSNCAINLGTNAILGVNRLCGCSGVDRDGNGIPCDSAEDFDTDLGLLDVGECNTDKDCKTGQICTEHKCLNDQLLPYPTYFLPLNHSTLVPPVRELIIGFNENIEFPKDWTPRRLVITSKVYYRTRPLEIPISLQKEGKTGIVGSGSHNLFPDERSSRNGSNANSGSDSGKWTWWNRSKNNHNNGHNGVTQIPVLYHSEIRGRKLIIGFDNRTPLPEDDYVVGLEPGAIVDLQGNPNDAIPIWAFTISRNVSCPYMYITGFGTNNGNVNGLYTPWKSPMNNKAVWIGGERRQFYVYYSQFEEELNQQLQEEQEEGGESVAGKSRGVNKSSNGVWVIDRDLDSDDILAYAESSLPDPHNHVPPDGKTTMWRKWSFLNSEEPEWLEQGDVNIICKTRMEKTPPSLIGIHPPLGSASVPTNNTEIRLTFNRPMNYGHWAWFNITGRNTGHLIHIPTDYEALYRGRYVISNQTSEVILRPYEPLMEGETYDITVELGALTDLTYQPWGNVGPNQLFFTTNGDVCPELELSFHYDQSEIERFSVVYTSNPRTRTGNEAEWDNVPEERNDLKERRREGEVIESTKKEGFGEEIEKEPLVFQAGTNAILTCIDGYSSAAVARHSSSEGRFACLSGKWKLIERIRCFQRCKPYPISLVSNQNYLIEDHSSDNETRGDFGVDDVYYEKEGPDYAHGSKLKVTCAGTQESETVICNDGTWSALRLVCGASCPPYSVPNENYILRTDELEKLKHITPDTEVNVVCSPSSDKVIIKIPSQRRENSSNDGNENATSVHHYLDNESREFTLICAEGLWKPKLGEESRCFRRCNSVPEYQQGEATRSKGDNPYKIEYNTKVSAEKGTYVHGTLAEIKCSENWSRVQNNEEATPFLSCNDGSWFVTDENLNPKGVFSYSSLEEEHGFKCEKKCLGLDIFTNRAYTVENLISGREIGTNNSKVKIQCNRNYGTTQIGTKQSDIIECRNGTWEIPKTVCLSGCESPELSLGNAYQVYKQLDSKRRDNFYYHGSRLSISCSDEGTLLEGSDLNQVATCTNGEWVFENTLVCASKCPVLKLPARYRLSSQNMLEDTPVDAGELRYVTCARPSGGSEIEEVLECINGEWVPSTPRLECASHCSLEDLNLGLGSKLNPSVAPTHQFFPSRSPIFTVRESLELLVTSSKRGNSEIRHGESVDVRCKQGYVRRTGPYRDKMECRNGVFQVPTLICQKPTCFDGIQNQGELGVDCGGRCEKKCPGTCFDGIFNGDETSVDCGGSCGDKNCPKCDDGIQNGDETGIDCGGSQCPACRPCYGFPMDSIPENTILSIDGGFTYIEDLEKESLLIENMSTASGSEIHIRCVPGWEREGSLESMLLVLSCNDGKWLFPDMYREESAIKCFPPSCDDGIQNGDEWGVDCGGSCENHCMSCFDGIKNGDETGVDCGGLSCRPCNDCESKALIREISTLGDSIVLLPGDVSDYENKEGITGESSLNRHQKGDFSPSYRHNSKLKMECVWGEKALDLVCNDGRWMNNELIRTFPCRRREDVHKDSTTGLSGYSGDLEDRRTERDTDKNRGAGRDEKSSDFDGLVNIPFSRVSYCNRDLSPCCELIKSFTEIWNGECGVMYRQGRDTMIKTFCKGKCMNMLREGLSVYESRKSRLDMNRIECVSAESIHSIIKSHLCQTSKTLNSGKSEEKSGCSYSFHETFLLMNDPLSLLEQNMSLKLVCDKDSCHRRNLRLIQALSKLTRLLSMEKDVTYGGRKDGAFHSKSSDEEYENVFVRKQSSSNTSRNSHASGGISGSGGGNSDENAKSLTKRSGVVDASTTKTNGALGNGEYWRQVLLIQSERALDLLCLSVKNPTNSKEKHSCISPSLFRMITFSSSDSAGEWLMSLIPEKKAKDKEAGDANGEDEERHMFKENLSDKCARNLPEDACFFQSMRIYGQLLEDVGRETKNREMTRVGYLYRSVGRYYCQENAEGRICGKLLFRSAFSGKGLSDWWSSLRESSLGGGSSRAVETACSLYHPNFSCTPHCRKRMIDQIEEKGCCFAAYLELQRGVLDLEKAEAGEKSNPEFEIGEESVAIPGTSRGETERARGLDVENYVGDFRAENRFAGLTLGVNTERSVEYLEQRCGFSLDRVCSSGVKTDNIVLEFKYKNLNYFEISNTMQEEYLRRGVRETVSRFLSLPVSDIPRMRSWPGSYVVEILIDAGLATRSVLSLLEESGKRLERELGRYDLIDEEYGLRVRKTTQSYSRTLSTKESPFPPFVGTFDMDVLSNQLDYPMCPKPTFELLNIEEGSKVEGTSDSKAGSRGHYGVNSDNSRESGYEITGDSSLKQGSYRNVVCRDSYDPISSSQVTSLSYICDNGRWRRTQAESNMLCRKSCFPFSYGEIANPVFQDFARYLKQQERREGSVLHTNMYQDEDVMFGNNVYFGETPPYSTDRDQIGREFEFDGAEGRVAPTSRFVVSGIGTAHGSTRSLTCSHGYVSDDPNVESETFRCENGNWVSNLNEDKTFNCVKGAESSLKYCKTGFLFNTIGTEKYQISQLLDLSTNINGDFNHNNRNDLKVFKITCTRGYETDKGPTLLACINGNYFNIEGDTKTLSKNNDSEYMYNLVMKTIYGGDFKGNLSDLTPTIPKVSFFSDVSGEYHSTHGVVSINKLVNCAPMKVMKLSESKGLSGPALYAILFAPLVTGMLILAIVFWFRKYKWRKSQPFREGKNCSREIALAILDINKKRDISDLENANISDASNNENPNNEGRRDECLRLKKQPDCTNGGNVFQNSHTQIRVKKGKQSAKPFRAGREEEVNSLE